jgi:hypothetical protein
VPESPRNQLAKKTMNRSSLRLPLAVRKSFAWFWIMMGVFGLIYIVGIGPALLEGMGLMRGEFGARVWRALEAVREWGGFGYVLSGLAVVNFALVAWFLKVKRGLLIGESDRLQIGSRFFLLHDQTWRPVKWHYRYTGRLGTALVLKDRTGKTWHLGLKDALLPCDTSDEAAVENCDFYLEDQRRVTSLLDWLEAAGVAGLRRRDEAEEAIGDARSDETLTFDLLPSMSSLKTWWPLAVGFFVIVYAIAGFAWFMNRVLHLPDPVAYGFTIFAIFGLIVTTVVFGTKRLRGRRFRLVVSREQLTILTARGGQTRLSRSLAELQWDTTAWTTYSRYAGGSYVGPVLVAKAAGKRLFRLATYDPNIAWRQPKGSVSTVDYVLGGPEWRLFITRLGLVDRIAFQVGSPEEMDVFS